MDSKPCTGGLPFFQANSGHWDGMAPLRGTGSGGPPLSSPHTLTTSDL